jgi:site-specific DNA recombinase
MTGSAAPAWVAPPWIVSATLLAQGEVEAVLILSPDRLARQFAYQYIVVEEFERAGYAIVFTSHNFGSAPADRMLREMTGVFAEYERAMSTERGR